MRPSKLRTAILFIGLGVTLLLYNMDRLDGRYFWALANLWPVLLVAIGIEVIARNSQARMAGYLSPLLLVAAFFYAGAGPYSGWDRGWISTDWDDDDRVRMVEQTFEVEGPVAQARYYIDLYNGRLNVGAGGEGLGRGEFRSSGRVRTSISESEGAAVVRVRQSGASRHREAEFDVYLSDEQPLTLDLKAEDAVVDLALDDLAVQTLYLEIATGEARLKLGRIIDSVWASLRPGLAKLNLMLPEGTGLRIEGPAVPQEGRFGNFELAPAADGLQTPDFATAPMKVTFHLEEPLSDVVVEAY